jgi:hypothetical protein
MFAEAFHSMMKGIHLALEVNTSFGNSMSVMGSSMESSSQKHRVPTDNRHQHRREEEKENLHTKKLQNKA